MFKHSCYIENSKEAREWLILIGLLSNVEDYQSSDILIAHHGSSFGLKEWNIGFVIKDDSFIDCLDNLPLFKALTAVRDDSDYMQEFVCDKTGKFVTYRGRDSFHKNISPYFHKATKEELIEKFKKDE